MVGLVESITISCNNHWDDFMAGRTIQMPED
jgi:hypothetical protein